MAYNTTQLETATNFMDAIKYMNILTNEIFAMLLLSAIFMVVLLSLRRFKGFHSFLAASFVATLLGILFVFTEMMSITMLAYPIVLLIFSIVGAMMSNR